MALQEQIIPIDFGQGIDTKTDPKQVLPGKLLAVENAVFTEAKRIRKRNGYTALTLNIVGGGALSSPQMIKSFKDELLCVDSGVLYSYSSTLSGWVNRGAYISTEVSKFSVNQNSVISTYVDSAVLNNIAVYCWEVSKKPHAAVVDLSTNTVLSSDTALSSSAPGSNAASSPKCVALGTSALGVVYVNGSNQLVLKILTTSISGAVFGSELVLASDLVRFSSFLAVQYDIQTTSTGAALSYAGSATFTGTPDRVITKTISTAGAVTNTNTESSAGQPSPVSLCVDSTNGNVWVYWIDAATDTNETLYYKVLSSSLGAVLSKTTIATGIYIASQLAARSTSTTQQELYYSHLVQNATYSTQISARTKSVTITSAGVVGTPATAVNGCIVRSRSFRIGSSDYMLFHYLGGYTSPSSTYVQPTFFLIQLGSPYTVVARMLAGSAGSAGVGYTANATLLSSTKVLFGLAERFQLISTASTVPALTGVTSYTVDFASAQANVAKETSQILALNGGVVSMYDGGSVTEMGFHLYPEIPSNPAGASTGGHISPGSYVYYAVYQWYDAQGNLHQSAPSLPFTATVSAGTNTNTLTLAISMAYLTQKTNVSIAIYRTVASGTVAYLVSDPVTTQANVSSTDYLLFTDTLADSSITGNAQLYTNGGVLDNSPPPPSMAMAARGNRLWMIDSENKNSIGYTKTFTKGTGISPSNLLTVEIDPKGGDCLGVQEMDEKMVVFKEDVPFYFAGDGANDTGTGSTLTVPQILPSDVGCSSPKSIILMPTGILFKSKKGIYLLDRALGLHYVGAEVEAYNSQTVTAATLITDKNQVRFLMSSGSTLIYDYAFNQWGTFTNHTGFSADNWNDLYVYVRTDGAIYQENLATFLDSATAYRLKAKFSHLAMAGIQGFQRLRRLAFLGDYANGSSASHQVQVSAAYDFSTSYSTPVAYTLGASSSSGVFQYRERLPIQKCDSVSLYLEEVTTGVAGEFVDFTNLSLEVAAKKGLRKMPAAQSTG